jgi:hypothetical protein
VPPTSTQKTAVWLAFVATALSLTAVIVVFLKRGEIATTPLFGGLFMLFMAIAGLSRLRKLR